MHFDDRLATVLRQPPMSEVIARIQYRQLLDLLGTLPSDAYGPQVDAAFDRLSELSGKIGAVQRARMLAEPGIRLRSPRLVALLAESDPPVASAAVAAAQMGEEEWLDLIPALPIRARGFLRHRRGLGARVDERLSRLGIRDRGLPASESAVAAAASVAPPPPTPPKNAQEPHPPAGPKAEPASSEQDDGIAALVRKIEAFRRTRETPSGKMPAADAPRLPFGDGLDEAHRQLTMSFDFQTDAQGRICWASHAVAPMAVGLPLAAQGTESPVQSPGELAAAILQRQPLVGQPVSISAAPTISGDWQVDAVPCFDEMTGRFTGYSGRARRPLAEHGGEAAMVGEADRMRQILHELRTPVGAIQLGAEMIQQQIYGPTPHEYRALAAAIASDTARILAGFEELDRLVKLDSGALEIEAGESDLAQVVTATVTKLQAHTGPRKSGFALDIRSERLPVSLEPIELERLVWRLLAGLAGASAPSEFLGLICQRSEDMVRMDVALPESLAEMDDANLFHARADGRSQALSAGMFGLGFTLRLAAAEARAAGGSLQREGENLRLTLPGVSGPSANISEA